MSNPYAPPDPDRPTPDRPDHKVEKLPREDAPDRGPRRASEPRPPDPGRRDSPTALMTPLSYSAFFILALLLVLAPVPWNFMGLACAITALVIGVRFAIRNRGALRGPMGVMLVVSMGFTGFVIAIGASSIALIGPQIEYQQCSAKALTLQAQEECRATFLEERGGLQRFFDQGGQQEP